jgi:hypothetical protein
MVWLFLVTKDANNHLVLLAWAVVDQENGPNWTWFIERVSMHLPLPDGATQAALISDMDKGITSNAAKSALNISYWTQTRCVRHFIDNLRTNKQLPRVTEEMEQLIYVIARHPVAGSVQRVVTKLHALNPKVAQRVVDALPQFANYLFLAMALPLCREGDILSNMAEQYNNKEKQTREESIEAAAKIILKHVQEQWFFARKSAYEWEQEGKVLTPFAEGELAAAIHVAKQLEVTILSVSDDGLQVQAQVQARPGAQTEHSLTVSASTHTSNCPCGWWRVRGFPCWQMLAVANEVRSKAGHLGINVDLAAWDVANPKWVSDVYTVATFKEQYSGTSPRFTTDDVLEDSKLLPPHAARKPGRPKKNRATRPPRKKLRAAASSSSASASSSSAAASSSTASGLVGPQGRMPSCSLCGAQGHYYNSCPHPNTMHVAKRVAKKADRIVLDLTGV